MDAPRLPLPPQYRRKAKDFEYDYAKLCHWVVGELKRTYDTMEREVAFVTDVEELAMEIAERAEEAQKDGRLDELIADLKNEYGDENIYTRLDSYKDWLFGKCWSNPVAMSN